MEIQNKILSPNIENKHWKNIHIGAAVRVPLFQIWDVDETVITTWHYSRTIHQAYAAWGEVECWLLNPNSENQVLRANVKICSVLNYKFRNSDKKCGVDGSFLIWNTKESSVWYGIISGNSNTIGMHEFQIPAPALWPAKDLNGTYPTFLDPSLHTFTVPLP